MEQQGASCEEQGCEHGGKDMSGLRLHRILSLFKHSGDFGHEAVYVAGAEGDQHVELLARKQVHDVEHLAPDDLKAACARESGQDDPTLEDAFIACILRQRREEAQA